jgi:glycosyltransferase involved in cell wall biosynthesis
MIHVVLIPSQRFVAEDNPVGGIFQLDLALALQRSGVKVGIVAPMARSLRGWRMRDLGRRRTWTHSDEHGLPILRPDHYAWIPSRTPYLSQWYQIRLGNKLFDRYVERHGKPDLVHAHNVLFAGAVALSLKTRLGLPYILTEHSSAYITRTIKTWQKPTVRRVLAKADHRLVVSNHLARIMEGQYAEFMHPWERMPNIVDSAFTTAPMRDPRSGEGHSAFCFLNIAAMLPWKNQSNLLRAFARSFKDRDDVRLRIVGDGLLRRQLEDLSRELGIRDRVTFLGVLPRDKVLQELQSSDAFVLSSDFETFGVVLIEALAMGKPVIATDCGGPREIVHDGNGILVPVGDVDALADAMSTMIHKKDRYSSQDLRNACIAEYGEKVIVARHSAIYKSVIES